MDHFKYVIGILFFAFTSVLTTKVGAQANKEYTVLGSFVFQNDVYNYTYKQTANGTSSFLIEQVEGITPDTIMAANNKLKGLKELIKANADSLKIADTATYDKHIDSIAFYFDSGLKKFKSSSKHLDSLLSSIKALLGKYNTDADTTKKNTLLGMISTLTDVRGLSQQVAENHRPQLVSYMSLENFTSIFKSQLTRFVDAILIKSNSKDLDRIATEKYVEIQARIEFKDDRPLTAYLQLLSKQVNIYTDDDETPKRSIVMNIDDIQFEFESGTIKNIYAQFSKVDDPQQKFFFQNTIPISISGKFAPTQFNKNRIFAINPKQIQTTFKDKTDPKNDDIYFKLGEVIRYVLFLETQKEDYSPEDQVYHLSNLQTSIELKKQLRSKILTVKAFTDFNGISDNKPNGLIQFEASIHANIVTYHKQIGKTNFAFVSGTDLLFTLNKIDDNHKYLQLTGDDLDKDQLAKNVKMFGVHPIEILRYQSSSINVYTNLIKYNIPDFATSMSLNASYGMLLTNVSDSLKVEAGAFTKTATSNQRSIYSRNFATNLSIDFSPDSRYGFRICYGGNWLWVKNTEVNLAGGASNRLSMLEFSGFLRTNDDSKIFFRWRTTNEFHNPQYSYNQVQVGYIVDIFKATK